MLTMRPRFDTVLVRFKPVVPRRPHCAVFLMNRDESGVDRGTIKPTVPLDYLHYFCSDT